MAEASGFMVVLCADCCHLKTRKNALKKAYFTFNDEEHWVQHADDGFDALADDFNSYLQANGSVGWYVDDVIETERVVKKGENPVNPVRVTVSW